MRNSRYDSGVVGVFSFLFVGGFSVWERQDRLEFIEVEMNRVSMVIENKWCSRSGNDVSRGSGEEVPGWGR